MLEKLTLQNFRSFTNKGFNLDSRSVIIGDNGSGKSTIIEAIRLLSVNKSFRTSRLDEAISFNEPYFRLATELKTNNKLVKLEFFYGQAFAEQPNKDRIMTVDGKTISLMEYLGIFPSVLFVPGDVDIVMGMPQVRRRYLDSILWQVSAEFRQNYLDLNRVLKERSTILFLVKLNRAGLDELQPWNELLVGLTEKIRQMRMEYLDFVTKKLEEIGQEQIGLKFKFKYQIEVEDIDSVQAQEIKNAQNLYGPHRDELEIQINGRSARRYASRGQARTAVVILKNIEASYLEDKLQTAPVILLDDMLSELDQKNAEFLFERLPKSSQIVATSLTGQKLLKNWQEIIL